jgi:methylenetetrahydrofolate dehydrogenase (NADP+)/methenyltetrahydrofolate cyclohydrolase
MLDGKPVAREMFERAREELTALEARVGFAPRLAVVRVGEDESSIAYERSILRAGRTAGIGAESILLSKTTVEAELEAAIRRLNERPDVHGIIVLQPLPHQLSRFSVADVVAPLKDIDGITTYNAGRLFHGDRDVLAPSTPAGGMALLKHYGVELAGRHAVVIGRSSVVGKPMAMMLLAENATVTICHSRTRGLAELCRQADVLVSAVGRAGIVRSHFVKPGATVVDFGVNFVGERMTGDVDAASVAEVAGGLTPVPGGTGRVTTAVLVRNTIKAAALQYA